MRFASRLLHRTACLAPATPADLIERGLEAARDVVEAAVDAVELAPAPRSHRGRTAVTVAAVTATALVATAAYVWWKRREPVTVASMDAMPPQRAEHAAVAVVEPTRDETRAAASAVDQAREVPIVVSFAEMEPEQCADTRRAAVASLAPCAHA